MDNSVLKTRIDGLLKTIESSKQREEELKEKIQENNKQTEKEEKAVMELHAKLQALEETLRQKEEDNERLKLQLRDRQVQAECVDEFKERTEVEEINEAFKSRQLRDEYGDMVIVNNTMRNKANEIVTQIASAEKQLRDEEALCEQEQQRVTGLQKERDCITERLQKMLSKQEDIKRNESEQREKLNALRQRHADTENRALKLEENVKIMEGQLEEMTRRLVTMKQDQDDLVTNLKTQQGRVDASLGHLQNTSEDIHAALRVKTRKL